MMIRRNDLMCVLAATFLLAACGAGETESEASYMDASAFEAGKADSSGTAVLTQNLNAAPWLGYDPAYDRVTPNSCIAADGVQLGPTEPRFSIPTLRLVRTRQQLAEELGVDLKFGGAHNVAKAQLAAKMLDEFSESRDRVALLLRVTQDFAVLRRPGVGGEVALDDRAREMLASQDLDGFLTECGSHYISGVRYGGEIDVLITFSADDEQHLNELTGSLGASAVGSPVELDAQTRRKLEESSSKLEVSITTAATGFTLDVPAAEVEQLGAECRDVFRSIGDGPTDGEVDSLLSDLVSQQSGAVPRLFSHIDCLRELMNVSMARDAERCRAHGECGGGNAAPREVILEEYGAAQASDLLPQLREIEAERRRLEVTLDDLAAMRVRTRSVYWDELAPFLAADHADKARFGIPSMSTELDDVADVQRVADTWAGRFAPGRGDIDRDLSRIIDACSAQAATDLFHRCVPQGVFVGELPAMAAATEALGEYADTSRILPLQVVIAPTEMKYRLTGITDAVEYCEEKLGGAYRLPRVDELADLDLLVRSGPVPGHTMWVSDDHDECSFSGAFYDPLAQPALDCSSLGSRGTVCVSPGGLFPSMPRP